jgi:hypothetical protein
MLDEPSMRRADFLPGTPVRLADGGWWTIPSPAPGSEAPAAPPIERYEALLAAIDEAEDEPERTRAELALAIGLLARNYQLSPPSFRILLHWSADDAGGVEMQRMFRRVALEHLAAPSSARMPDGQTSPLADPVSPDPGLPPARDHRRGLLPGH